MSSASANGVHLSFTIGPVQGFVSQARRTRDLWAGSWLLSFLAETALAAAERAGGRAVLPHRPSECRGKVTPGRPIGGYPNRFELSYPGSDQARAGAEAAAVAFQHQWKDVSERVWKKYVNPVAPLGKETRDLWDRQTEGFWELSWVVGQPEDGGQTLGVLASARKNFRNVPRALEPGVKCSLMGTHQEISGHLGRGSRTAQEAFWSGLRARTGSLDLKDTERLCAIALIKRLYPRTKLEALDFDQVAWPSTSFIAALPWLKGLEADALSKAQDYARRASSLDVARNEARTSGDEGVPWAAIDAQAWFANSLRRNEWEIAEEGQQDLNHLLRGVYQANGDRGPVPFYALLMMDGDSLGKLLAQLKSPSRLSEGLKRFADTVEAIVSEHSGRTVYAGGDDVLALLPAESALAAADSLARAYRESFEESGAKEKATISGAIVYASLHFPLRQVVRTGHRLLDEVAKERAGRDALAFGILLGSGLSAEWSAPFAVVRGQHEKTKSLMALLERFGSEEKDSSARPNFNASFLYLLREKFSRLFLTPLEKPGEFGCVEADDEVDLLRDLAHAEYRRRLSKEQSQSLNLEDTRAEIDDLMSLSRRWTRSPGALVAVETKTFSFDGWKLARFLQQVKEGKVDSHD